MLKCLERPVAYILYTVKKHGLSFTLSRFSSSAERADVIELSLQAFSSMK